ncbi:MAG: HAMP domain-containing histidine kinase [Phycisphaerales bacterium]|nr:HAMP domain-containing histidine kinase [Phycisphaerales bacterium]
MRTARRLTWMTFAVCALLVVDGLGWVTWQVLSLERRERDAQASAKRQEAVRLALWRMDGLLSPLIAGEAARPYFQYRAFYPAERAYSRMWEPMEPGESLEPSPLLTGAGKFIRLHFEGTRDGWLTSPEVPDQDMRDRVGQESLPLSEILEAERKLLDLTTLLRGAPEPVGVQFGAVNRGVDTMLAQRSRELQLLAQAEPTMPPTADLLALKDESAGEEKGRASYDFQARQQAVDSARNINDAVESSRAKPDRRTAAAKQAAGAASGADRVMAEGSRPDPGREEVTLEAAPDPPAPSGQRTVQTWPFVSTWLRPPGGGEPELLFIRVVRVGSEETLQGFWVDWPSLRAELLASVHDLLPDAALQPLPEEGAAGVRPTSAGPGTIDAGRLLAGVPAALLPGSMRMAEMSGLTPTRTVMLVAWLAVVAAIIAIAAVLRASLALSERRGRFVSAVTHELRTPLTTFCLYSQMLDDGMVKEESRRGEYFATLRRESERLAGIVENVLVYARMGGARREAVRGERVGDILEGVLPSLRERAEQAGMTFDSDSRGADELVVGGDAQSVGRILVNLVDNACKYGASGEDLRVTIRVREAGGGVEFRVRDFGAGVPRRERRRIFSPFVRAREHGGDGTSGLGLGLALARGVARSLGGELRLARSVEPGAEFVLWLPRTPLPPAS